MLDYRIDTFLLLCSEMNFRKTADILGITQPAVTQRFIIWKTSTGRNCSSTKTIVW